MREKRGRILFVLLVLGAGFAAVGARLIHLQIFEKGDYVEPARSDAFFAATVSPTRPMGPRHPLAGNNQSSAAHLTGESILEEHG